MNYVSIPCKNTEVALNPGLLSSGSGYVFAYRRDYLDPVYTTLKERAHWSVYWGIWRRVIIAEMTPDFKLTGREVEHSDGEDARLFRAMDRTWCSFVNKPQAWRIWLMEFDLNKLTTQPPFRPDYGINRVSVNEPSEKNWTWMDGARWLDCVYSWNPFRVTRFDETGALVDSVQLNDRPVWRHGPVLGGTPSVLLPSGERFSVFHGYLSGLKHNRCYYAGGIFHEPEWPYKPIRVLKKPLLHGARRIKRWPWMACESPRVRAVYPCGLVAKYDRIVVSFGVDDCACAIKEFTYSELEEYA